MYRERTGLPQVLSVYYGFPFSIYLGFHGVGKSWLLFLMLSFQLISLSFLSVSNVLVPVLSCSNLLLSLLSVSIF